jgi:hypothetical protein
VRFLRFCSVLALAITMLGGGASIAQAQNMTAVDVERLQDAIADASRDVSALQTRDSALASQLQKELDALRDESVYYKVRISRNEVVPRAEYFDLRDKVDGVRSRARRGDAASSSSSSSSSSSAGSSSSRGATSTMDVPVGTELDVRLSAPLSSGTAVVEDRFEATTLVDLQNGNRVVIPAGAVLRGVVSSVTKAGRVERTGKLTLAFDQVTISGRNYPIRATVTQALESEGVKGEAGRIGTGAGIGAIIGGILGGFKGAMAGILIGGGGTVAATEGKDVELPAGTVLRIRLDSGLDVRR